MPGVAVLSRCAREHGPIRRLQWIERTVPAHGDDLASYLQEERDRSVRLDSDLVRSYIELLGVGGAGRPRSTKS